ncbi:hypothetical protein JTB14_027147 [Gonioctena quinquepunctata]|nr:hypothetical protein JTB14_027147 [Gonioctena quinquepunctata]
MMYRRAQFFKTLERILLIIIIIEAYISSGFDSVPNLESKVICERKSRTRNEVDGMPASNYSVLYNYLTGTGAHNFSDSVTIGFLGAYRQAQVVLGALPLAVDAVNGDKGDIHGSIDGYEL